MKNNRTLVSVTYKEWVREVYKADKKEYNYLMTECYTWLKNR
jgi:hypothetical protein